MEISDCAEPHVHEGAAEARGAEPSTGCAAMAGLPCAQPRGTAHLSAAPWAELPAALPPPLCPRCLFPRRSPSLSFFPLHVVQCPAVLGAPRGCRPRVRWGLRGGEDRLQNVCVSAPAPGQGTRPALGARCSQGAVSSAPLGSGFQPCVDVCFATACHRAGSVAAHLLMHRSRR